MLVIHGDGSQQCYSAVLKDYLLDSEKSLSFSFLIKRLEKRNIRKKKEALEELISYFFVVHVHLQIVPPVCKMYHFVPLFQALALRQSESENNSGKCYFYREGGDT